MLNPITKVMAFGGGVFGRCWGHEGAGLMNGISALIRETFLAPSIMCGYREETSLNQEAVPYQTPHLPHLDSELPTPLEL